MPDSSHYLASSLREKIVEHLFLGKLLRCLWQNDVRDIEVLRSEVDNGGYDLVLESNSTWRHVQLKASHRLAKTSHVPINIGLTRKPSGCVVWILFDAATLELGPYLWLGRAAKLKLEEEDLGDQVARQARANSRGIKRPRPNVRMVPKTKFETLETVDEVARALFISQKAV